mmetsp:Transcript_137684/g.343659  ORF Transcript_137684/g.343659 Transcript_137684/m.343659 type:complete len:204 (-) Transcript_137684:78-689(-)
MINLQMKSASEDISPASAKCSNAGEPGDEVCHHARLNTRPSNKAAKKSPGKDCVVSGMNSKVKSKSAMCTVAPMPKERARAAFQASIHTCGSLSASAPPTARPAPCTTKAFGKSLVMSNRIDCKNHTCQRGSMAKGTRMDLSRPSVWTLGFTWCMTTASATSTASSDKWQATKPKCNNTAAATTCNPTSAPVNCEVPTSYSRV